MTKLFEPIKAKLAHHFNIPEASITPDATFEDLGLDSLGTVELLCVLQDELGLRLPADDALKAPDTTIAQAVAAVEAAQPQAAGEDLRSATVA
ncbi:phosphopantetheine-binding protein [Kitasatospora viridis]|uniref:Acyl carrier protein n=1 Tax=Kitasatospora viridis TaxID=281105 RepID=A0A561TW20_9ACTN|nr:phosphopantetheine-binding protein [Kitasatospora viridis]TWF91308.1 acyl carrier protein [Kitasatospora viridis]